MPLRRRVQAIAVGDINSSGPASLTTEGLVEQVGMTAAEFGLLYDGLDAVYDAIVSSYTAEQAVALAATVVRRRSQTDLIQTGLDALWDLVELHPKETRAVQLIGAFRLTSASRRDRPEGAALLSTRQTDVIEHWLRDAGQVQGLVWDQPSARLARFAAATINGLINDYLETGNAGDIRTVLNLLAYQLGQYGRRAWKNLPH